jgi:hypothetical protein
LFRVFRLSVSLQILMLALLGSGAVSAGWRIASTMFLVEPAGDGDVVVRFVEVVTRWPGQIVKARFVQSPSEVTRSGELALKFAASHVGEGQNRPMVDGGRPLVSLPQVARLVPIIQRTPAYGLSEPFRRVFMHRINWGEFFFYLVGGFWTLLVWCLFGGAITRITVVRLGRDERVGLRESLDFARRKLASFFGAPLLPLLAIALLGVPLMLLGLLMRLELGVLLAGILWAAIAVIGFVMALFGIGLLFGWPLMWSTISTEGTDAFDAISRSYAYTFQRPLHYALYAVFATLLGGLGWIVVGFFCDVTIRFADWAIAWGAGPDRFSGIPLALSDQAASGTFWAGAKLIGFFTTCVRAFLTAFAAGYFWVAAGAVYLLLRRDADQTEIDDIFLEEEDLEFGLPTLEVDEAGVPGVTDVDSADESIERSSDV